MDAANVDLKGFTDEFYVKLTGAQLAPGARHARVPQARDRRLVRDHHAAHPRRRTTRTPRAARDVAVDHARARARRAAALHRVPSRLQDDRPAAHAGRDAHARAPHRASTRGCTTSTRATCTTARAAPPSAPAAARRSSCATGTASRPTGSPPKASARTARTRDPGALRGASTRKRQFGRRRIPVAIGALAPGLTATTPGAARAGRGAARSAPGRTTGARREISPRLAASITSQPGSFRCEQSLNLQRAEERAELAHRLADLVLGEVEEAEGLEAGRVDDRGVAVEAVEAREGRGVRARIARGGEVAHARHVARAPARSRSSTCPCRSGPTSSVSLFSRCGSSGATSNLADMVISV